MKIVFFTLRFVLPHSGRIEVNNGFAVKISRNTERKNQMEDNIIMLEDENGNQIEFAVIDVFELNNETYFALLEVVDEGEETDEVLIMKVDETDEENPELITVDDEQELEAAFAEFLRRDEEAGE